MFLRFLLYDGFPAWINGTKDQIMKNLVLLLIILLTLTGFNIPSSWSTANNEISYPIDLDNFLIDENTGGKLEARKDVEISFDLKKDTNIAERQYLVILEIRQKGGVTLDLQILDGAVMTAAGHETIRLTPRVLGDHEFRVFLLSSLEANPQILSRTMSIDVEVVEAGILDENAKDSEGLVVPASYTFLVYMVGSTLESRGYFATEDLKEMMHVGSSKEINVIVQTGGSANATINEERFVDFTKVQRHKILNDNIELLEDLGTQNMGEAKTLKDFLEYGMSEFPAEKYAVVLWNDGGGINGFGTDNMAQDSLTPTELESAFSSAKLITNEDIELIGFDACLMSTFEVITKLDNYGHFMASSEDLEPSWGWDYQAILNSLNINPDQDGAALGKTIADSYFDHIKEKATLYEDYDSSKTATLSVIDLRNGPQLESAIVNFASSFDNEINSIFHAQMIAETLSHTERFGIGSIEGSGHIDLYNLVHNLEPAFPGLKDSAAKVYAAINNTVIYKVNGESRNDSHGISIYLPLEEVAESEVDSSRSDTILQQTLPKWREIITNYKKFLEADIATPQAGPFGYLNEKFYGATATYDVYKFKVYITKEVIENTAVQVISYTEDNISVDFEGRFEYPYRKDLISFCNDTECIPVSMYVHHTSTTKFAVFPVRLESQDIDADVLMMYEIHQGDSSFEFLGAWPGFDEEGNASRELWPVQVGDKIHTSYFQLDIRNGEKYNKQVEGDVIEVTDNFGPAYHSYGEVLKISGAICDYSDNCSFSDSFGYGAALAY